MYHISILTVQKCCALLQEDFVAAEEASASGCHLLGSCTAAKACSGPATASAFHICVCTASYFLDT